MSLQNASRSPQSLSSAQFGIWLGQAIDRESTIYNAAEYLEFTGDFNRCLFERAASQILQQAEALNTRFYLDSDLPVQQIVHRQKEPKVEFKDLSSAANPHQAALELMQNELTRPVKIGEGKNYHQLLIKISNTQHLWFLCIHHIASDGYSFALLIDSLLTYYKSLLKNQNAAPPEFGDYSKVLIEDTQYQKSASIEKDKQYWLARLKTAPHVRSIAASSSKVSNHCLKSATVITADSCKQLEKIALNHRSGWSELLLTLVANLIHQYTGVKSTILGMPVSARMGSASANVPCMHMNIVPLIINYEQVDNLAQLLDQINQQIKTGRRHFRYRYEELKKVTERNTLENKLFGAVVNIIPFERDLAITNCNISAHTLSTGPVEDLSFSFIRQPDGSLQFELYANPTIYSQKNIDEFQKKLVKQLDSLSLSLEEKIFIETEKLSYLSAPPLIKTNFNDNSILNRIYNIAKSRPDAIALTETDKQLSYAELIDTVNAIAVNLNSFELSKKQTIALLFPRCTQAIATMLAILLLEHRFVFIDPEAPLKRNLMILNDASPDRVVLHSSINETLRKATDSFVCISDFELATPVQNNNIHKKAVSQRWCSENRELNHDAYLIYTSGSTGQPKGVIIGYQALNDFALAAAQDYPVKAQDSMLQFAPLHFDTCIEEIFVTLSTGARLVLRNNEMLNSPATFLAQCERWEITILDLPTAYWHELSLAVESQNLCLPAFLKTIIIGGEAVQTSRVEQWRQKVSSEIQLLNTYGPSEATVVATSINLACDVSPRLIGRPLRGRQIAVVDAALNILPRGETGELLLLGAGLGKGYLGLQEKTAENFVQIPSPFDKNIMRRAYRTGDSVHITACGNIEFSGRIDQQIKISGYRIEPGEIEQAILSNTCLDDIAITILTNEQNQPLLVAHLATHDKSWNEEKLRNALKGALPGPMLPAIVILYSSLPKNSSGKINRKKLEKRAAFRYKENTPDKHSSSFEQAIINIWKQVLGKTDITTNDDFFSIGGQSLQSIQVANRLSALLKQEIPVSLIFDNPTPGSLCKVLNEHMTQYATTGAHKISEKNRFINQHNIHNKTVDLMQQDIDAFMQCIQRNEKSFIKPETASKGAVHKVLLTGATGFVGAQLLSQLLEQTDATILCTVRTETPQQGLRRLKSACHSQKINIQEWQRVVPVCLNLTKVTLGLNQTDYDQLSAEISQIFHNAAQTSVVRDYQSLRESNVLATANLLLLSSIKAVPFNHVSTIAVAPEDNKKLPESFVSHHSALKDGYQQSKWVAESLVEIAQQKGYPVNVYRLARVTGTASSGYVNQKDLVWNIIRTGLNNQLLPDIKVTEPWTPVDRVSQFIITHGTNCPGEGVFNLTPEHLVNITEIFHWLKALDFKFKVTDLQNWCQHIRQHGDDQDLAILSFFDSKQTDSGNTRKSVLHSSSSQKNNIHYTPAYNNQKFMRLAAHFNICLPRTDKKIFVSYVEYALNHQLIPEPGKKLSLSVTTFLSQQTKNKSLAVEHNKKNSPEHSHG